MEGCSHGTDCQQPPREFQPDAEQYCIVHVQLFFTFVFTYPSFPQPLALPTGQVDLETWKRVMITLEGPTNSTFAIDTYNRLVPEPAGPQVTHALLSCAAVGAG